MDGRPSSFSIADPADFRFCSRSSDACFTAYIKPAFLGSSPTNSRTHQSYLCPQVISKFIFQMNGTPFRAHSIARRRFSRILSSVSASA